jgi:hypothetical protein
MSYLKYYFGHNDIKPLFLDSVLVAEDAIVSEPAYFLKWYEDGDFAPTSSGKTGGESPIFAALFAPRTVTFSVDDLLQTRKNNAN